MLKPMTAAGWLEPCHWAMRAAPRSVRRRARRSRPAHRQVRAGGRQAGARREVEHAAAELAISFDREAAGSAAASKPLANTRRFP